jgi:hypothetical protein
MQLDKYTYVSDLNTLDKNLMYQSILTNSLRQRYLYK